MIRITPPVAGRAAPLRPGIPGASERGITADGTQQVELIADVQS
ncbi:hypothetical protein ACQCX1_14960 [Propionibacteriaceae bacterium Y2014]